jgi:hypothetical protein
MLRLLEDRFGTVLGALDRLACGAAIVRRTGEIVTRNAEARRIISQSDGLREKAQGHLRCLESRQTASLHAGFSSAADCAAGTGQSPALQLNIEQSGGKAPLLAEVIPLVDLHSELGGPPDLALLVLIDPENCDYLDGPRYARYSGLTAAQGHLCARLIKGQTTEHIAQDLGQSPETTRDAIRAFFHAAHVSDRLSLLRQIHKVVPAII